MPTPTSSLNAFVATATKAARLAAREITRAAQDRDQLEITDKARNDFVTSADKAAEAAIVRELMEAYPQHGILTEEAGRLGPKSDFLWIIDPIDGTTNFIHGLPQYAVSIALTYCGEPIAAVVYDVAKNELFTAAKGQGAKLDSRRIRVSENDEMRRSLIGTGSRSVRALILRATSRASRTLPNALPASAVRALRRLTSAGSPAAATTASGNSASSLGMSPLAVSSFSKRAA